MIRRLTVWIAALTLAMLMMAIVLAGAARAQEAAGGRQGAITAPGIGQLRTDATLKNAWRRGASTAS